MDDAFSVFRSMEGTRNVITCSSMVGGLVSHGRGMEAMEMFEQVNEVRECRPDGITFVWVRDENGRVHGLPLDMPNRKFSIGI